MSNFRFRTAQHICAERNLACEDTAASAKQSDEQPTTCTKEHSTESADSGSKDPNQRTILVDELSLFYHLKQAGDDSHVVSLGHLPHLNSDQLMHMRKHLAHY